MKTSNYAQIRDHLIANEPFEGNTMRGGYEGDTYRVYSYSTLIYSEFDGKCQFWNGGNYSRTTTRHQSILRQVKRNQIRDIQNEHSRRSGVMYWK